MNVGISINNRRSSSGRPSTGYIGTGSGYGGGRGTVVPVV